MRYWLCLATSLVAFGAAAFAADQPAAALPVVSHPGPEVFGALPLLWSPKLSPNGTYFACMQSYKGRPVITVSKIGDTSGKWPVILPVPKMIIDGFRWVKDDKLVLTLKWTRNPSGDKATFYHYVAVSADGTVAVPLTEEKRPDESVVTDIRMRSHMVAIANIALDEPDSIYAGMSNGALARINLTLGDFKLMATPGASRVAIQWITDGHGNPIARIDQSFNPLVHHLYVRFDDSWHEIATTSAEGDTGIGIYGLSLDGKSLVTNGPVTGSTARLYKTEIAATYKSSEFWSNPQYDIDDVITDEWTDRVIGVSYTDDRSKPVYFDPAMAGIQRGLETNFPNSTVAIVSTDTSRNKVFFRISSPTEAPVYFYLNRTTHEAKPIGRAYPKLTGAALGEMKPYGYKARDGLDIPAYLTLPSGKPPAKLPLIVMPHGGPDSRTFIDFSWWTQFYATRGYAVFQPNYRGSSGYGLNFTRAGLKQWGLKMQDDITDGVKKLIADGIVDPKRICIVGASYGGYAALAGAAFTPDLYACAVSVNGVTDLPDALRDEAKFAGTSTKQYSFWLTRIGDPSDDRDRLVATSPARHATNVKCPVLLLQSVNDTTVRASQSETMQSALKAAGKSVELIQMEGDDHYLELPETRIRMLTETERFIAKAIGN